MASLLHRLLQRKAGLRHLFMHKWEKSALGNQTAANCNPIFVNWKTTVDFRIFLFHILAVTFVLNTEQHGRFSSLPENCSKRGGVGEGHRVSIADSRPRIAFSAQWVGWRLRLWQQWTSHSYRNPGTPQPIVFSINRLTVIIGDQSYTLTTFQLGVKQLRTATDALPAPPWGFSKLI